MNADKLREQINSMVSHVTFTYQGRNCGVDPLSRDRFDLWCGDDSATVDSIDSAMDTPFFGGKPLKEIAQDITDIGW